MKSKDYELDEKNKNVILTDLGIDKIEKLSIQKNILKNNNFYDPENLSLVHHVNQHQEQIYCLKKILTTLFEMEKFR